VVIIIGTLLVLILPAVQSSNPIRVSQQIIVCAIFVGLVASLLWLFVEVVRWIMSHIE